MYGQMDDKNEITPRKDENDCNGVLEKVKNSHRKNLLKKAKLSLFKNSTKSKTVKTLDQLTNVNLNETDDFQEKLSSVQRLPPKRKHESVSSSVKIGQSSENLDAGEVTVPRKTSGIASPSFVSTDPNINGDEDSQQTCPTCQRGITSSQFQAHILQCLKQFSLVKKTSSQEEVFKGNEGADEYQMCQICQKDIKHMNSTRRTQHVNRCMDQKEDDSKEEAEMKKLLEVAKTAILDCPICGKPLKTTQSRNTHMKKCAIVYNVPMDRLLVLIKDQEEQRKIQVAAGILPTTVRIKATKPKSTNQQKISTKKIPKNKSDEDIQLAIALSKSILEQQKIQDQVITGQNKNNPGKKSRNKKNKIEEIPLILQLSKEQAKDRIANKLTQLLIPQSSQEEIYATPPGGSNLEEMSVASTVYKSTNSSNLQPRLWNESNLMDATSNVDRFYVTALMPTVTIATVKAGSKLKRLSEIPGRRSSLELEREKELKLQEQMTDRVSGKHDYKEMSPATSKSSTNQVSSSPPITQTGTILAQLAAEADATSGHLESVNTSSHSNEALHCSGFCPENPLEIPVDIQKSTLDNLQSSLLPLVNSNMFTDVTIVTRDQKIPAHKIFLYTRCPKLMEELSLDGTTIDMSNYNEEVILSILTFIYSGTIHLYPGSIQDVLELSTLLGLSQLANICKSVIDLKKNQPVNEEPTEDQNLDILEQTLWSSSDSEDEVEGHAEGDEVEGQEDVEEDDWREMFYTQREKLRKQSTEQKEDSERDDLGEMDVETDEKSDNGNLDEETTAMNHLEIGRNKRELFKKRVKMRSDVSDDEQKEILKMSSENSEVVNKSLIDVKIMVEGKAENMNVDTEMMSTISQHTISSTSNNGCTNLTKPDRTVKLKDDVHIFHHIDGDSSDSDTVMEDIQLLEHEHVDEFSGDSDMDFEEELMKGSDMAEVEPGSLVNESEYIDSNSSNEQIKLDNDKKPSVISLQLSTIILNEEKSDSPNFNFSPKNDFTNFSSLVDKDKILETGNHDDKQFSPITTNFSQNYEISEGEADIHNLSDKYVPSSPINKDLNMSQNFESSNDEKNVSDGHRSNDNSFLPVDTNLNISQNSESYKVDNNLQDECENSDRLSSPVILNLNVSASNEIPVEYENIGDVSKQEFSCDNAEFIDDEKSEGGESSSPVIANLNFSQNYECSEEYTAEKHEVDSPIIPNQNFSQAPSICTGSVFSFNPSQCPVSDDELFSDEEMNSSSRTGVSNEDTNCSKIDKTDKGGNSTEFMERGDNSQVHPAAVVQKQTGRDKEMSDRKLNISDEIIHESLPKDAGNASALEENSIENPILLTDSDGDCNSPTRSTNSELVEVNKSPSNSNQTKNHQTSPSKLRLVSVNKHGSPISLAAQKSHQPITGTYKSPKKVINKLSHEAERRIAKSVGGFKFKKGKPRKNVSKDISETSDSDSHPGLGVSHNVLGSEFAEIDKDRSKNTLSDSPSVRKTVADKVKGSSPNLSISKKQKSSPNIQTPSNKLFQVNKVTNSLVLGQDNGDRNCLGEKDKTKTDSNESNQEVTNDHQNNMVVRDDENSNSGGDSDVEILSDNIEEKTNDYSHSPKFGKSLRSQMSKQRSSQEEEDIQLNSGGEEDVWEGFDDVGYNEDDVYCGPPSPSKHQVSCDNEEREITEEEEETVNEIGEDLNDSSLWEDDNEPPISVSPNNVTTGTNFKTPTVSESCKKKQRKKNWVPPSPFTPIPDYPAMNTPQLKKHIDKFGLRPACKKRMVTVLTQIYSQTHQYETDSDCDLDEEKLKRIKQAQIEAAAATSLKPGQKSGKNSKKSTKQPVKRKKTKEVKNKEVDILPEASCSDDQLSSSQSSDISDLPEESFIAGPEDDDDDDSSVPTSQKCSKEELFKRLSNFIQDSSKLYTQVLTYQPLEIDVLKKNLTDVGLKCSMDKLLEFLDEKCINFTMKNNNKRKPRKQRGRVKVKKVKPVADV